MRGDAWNRRSWFLAGLLAVVAREGNGNVTGDAIAPGGGGSGGTVHQTVKVTVTGKGTVAWSPAVRDGCTTLPSHTGLISEQMRRAA